MVKLAADAPPPPVDTGGGGVDPELHPATPSTPTASSGRTRTTRPRCAFMMYNTKTTPFRFNAVAKSSEGGSRPAAHWGRSSQLARPATVPKPQYGQRHRAERERLRPQVEAGLTHCHNPHCVMPTRWIAPGQRWDLGHTADGKGYRGPEHSRCNQLECTQRGQGHHPTRAQPAHHHPTQHGLVATPTPLPYPRAASPLPSSTP